MHSENVKIYITIAHVHWSACSETKDVSVNWTVFIYSFMAKNEPEEQNRNSPKNFLTPLHMSQLLKCSQNKF